MRYYIIAGEASGDLHGSLIIRELKKLDPNANFRVWGGDRMQAEGAEVVKHYRDLAFMGFLEVLLNLSTILRNLRFCRSDLLSYDPDVLICVDYPGFNMRIARFAHARGIRVVYYIAPQVWAWRQSRIHTIHRIVDKAFVVLPFEKEFHARFGYKAEFVGHPLVDAIRESDSSGAPVFRQKNHLDEKPIIAVLPGSRKQEIKRLLPVMLSVADGFPQYRFVVAGVSAIDPDVYSGISGNRDIRVVTGQTYDLLRNADAALVTSGTATLETALLGVPQVVCYRMSFTSALVAWMVVKVKFISLVNLILDKEAVKELVQYDCNRAKISAELDKILNNESYRQEILEDYQNLRARAGEYGASSRAAKQIWEFIKNQKVKTN